MSGSQRVNAGPTAVLTHRASRGLPIRALLVLIACLAAVLGGGALSIATASFARGDTGTTTETSYTYDQLSQLSPATQPDGTRAAGHARSAPRSRATPGDKISSAAPLGFAAEGGSGETVQLFRSVDAGEFDSIALLHGGDAITVETRIPKSLADQLFLREGKLDGVRPAIYANGGQLDLINLLMDGIRAWP